MGTPRSKEEWDAFFNQRRGSDDSFDRQYSDWADLRQPLLSHFPASDPDSVRILVPGCGSSRLSEFVYDAGFRYIINVDFSRVVITDMLRRYGLRSEMKWHAKDVADLKMSEKMFDIVLDKGTLDCLVGTEVALKYLKEVKKVLKSGGKFICLTRADPLVLGLLLPAFRFGWEMTIQVIPNKPTEKSNLENFMVVITKIKFGKPTSISLLEDLSVSFGPAQADPVGDAIQAENRFRDQDLSCEDVTFALKDLELWGNGELKELIPGQRIQLFLGEEGSSVCYRAVLLDAKQQIEPFKYHCAVFVLPKIPDHEMISFSEAGQWQMVKNSMAARLFIVFLDSRHMPADMGLIESELSPIVEDLAPNKSPIEFMIAGEDVEDKNIVHEAKSEITGPVIVQDVVVFKKEENSITKGPMCRRLVFKRNVGMVQSEAFLIEEGKANQGERDIPSTSKRKKGSRKKGNKNNALSKSSESKSNFKIDHSRLVSVYHNGILSGFSLIASSVKTAFEAGEKVKAVIVGLGAGLLPMFLHKYFPLLQIEVVELDPVVVDLAKKYFGFIEDQQMKVHVEDGVKYVMKSTEREQNDSKDPLASGTNNKETRILIIDADSADLSSGLACPHPEFMEEPFLKSAKEFLSHGGLFVTNLVPRSAAIREMIISRIKVVFDQLFSLQLEEEVNEVLYACTDITKIETENSKKFAELMKFPVEVANFCSRIQKLK